MDLQSELKTKDEEYVKSLKKQADDIGKLKKAMKDSRIMTSFVKMFFPPFVLL